MSHSPDHDLTNTARSTDRRRFLQQAGLGAAAVGAWVAPQVLFTATAAAGCTPITKLLQVPACTCPSAAGAITNTDANLPSCVPGGWASGRNDGVDLHAFRRQDARLQSGSFARREAAHLAARGQHAMTRHHQRKRIARHRLPDGA